MGREQIKDYFWVPGVKDSYAALPHEQKSQLHYFISAARREIEWRFEDGNCHIPYVDRRDRFNPKLNLTFSLGHLDISASQLNTAVQGLFYAMVAALACKNAASDYARMYEHDKLRFDIRYYDPVKFLQRFDFERVKFAENGAEVKYKELVGCWLAKEPIGQALRGSSPLERYLYILTPEQQSAVNVIASGKRLALEVVRRMLQSFSDDPAKQLTIAAFVDNVVYNHGSFRTAKGQGTYRVLRKVIGEPFEDKFLSLLPPGTDVQLEEIAGGRRFDELILRDLSALAKQEWVPEEDKPEK